MPIEGRGRKGGKKWRDRPDSALTLVEKCRNLENPSCSLRGSQYAHETTADGEGAMGTTARRLHALTVCSGTMVLTAHAQGRPAASPVPDDPRYVVTHLEVMPTAKADALKLIRTFRDVARTEAGNLRAEALQRIGQTHQFVLLEAWKDQAAADARATTSAAAQFRDKMQAIQNAPIDERVHFALSVGPIEMKRSGAPIAVVTHVDVIPLQRETGTAITRQLADDGRKDDGNLRFEALTQVNRQNHFTVIELWRDRKAAEAHGMAAHTRAFRGMLAPAGGALYDERPCAQKDGQPRAPFSTVSVMHELSRPMALATACADKATTPHAGPRW